MRNTQARERLNQYAIVKSRFIAEEDLEKCRGCKTCVDTRCPVGAVPKKYYPEHDRELAYTDPAECIGCGLCVLTCPVKAREMKLYDHQSISLLLAMGHMQPSKNADTWSHLKLVIVGAFSS
jgi:ferredoxin